MDWHDGRWWMTFADYVRPLAAKPGTRSIGGKAKVAFEDISPVRG